MTAKTITRWLTKIKYHPLDILPALKDEDSKSIG
jgi:hypothetical protein